ncbi:lectin like domain-containing protein [Thioflavicoccus mobilis]|uniref:lectin like domain-containing protein n=1 Tax=Thioflavicoccus mobilis TaxID=80679 RepID=UPI003CCBEC06
MSAGGYYNVEHPATIPLAANQQFAVLLRGYRSSSTVNAIHLRVGMTPHNDEMSVSEGESFVSRDGWSWFDMTRVPFPCDDQEVGITSWATWESRRTPKKPAPKRRGLPT